MTLKTGAMMLKIQLYITGINYILKYIRSHFILRFFLINIIYDFCLNKLLILCLLIVSKLDVKFRYWVGLGM